MSGQFENQSLGFAYAAGNNSNSNAKLSDDRYEIYVNNDFVGYKTLTNASDDLSDVDDFLNAQGINDFQVKLDGDHYYIKGNNGARIKEALSVYCHNR